MPNGQLIGSRRGSARPWIRTMEGGEPAARQMFERLTAGRGGIDVTPRGYDGQIIELPDGSRIGYRLTSSSTVTPTIDINDPRFLHVRKLH